MPAGAVVAITLHDFWYLCPRGQRFTPRGHLCAEIQPWRCSACIAKKRVRYALNGWVHETRRLGHHLRRPWSAATGIVKYAAENLALAPIRARQQNMREHLEQAHVCFAPSRFVLEEYRRHGIRTPRMEHSENGMEVAWAQDFDASPDPGSPLRFGFLGSFLPSKGVDLLVDAFQSMPEGRAELHLHGTSVWDGGRMEQELRSGNRHADVHFHGAFAHERLPEILASLDVLVVPSRWFENAPLTLDEAALAQRPVIAADHGGLREIVHRRGNGVLFRPGDVASLRECMLRFLDEPTLWQELRQPKVPVRTVAEQVDELEGVYRELVNQAATRPKQRTGGD